PDVEPLRHRDREAPRHHWRDAEAVDRDQLSVEPAEIEMKRAHRRAVDDAQQHAPAGLDLDHLRIVSVRSLARNASYLTSLRSGLRPIAMPPLPALPDLSMPFIPPAGAIAPAGAGCALCPVGGIDGATFLRSAKICSGGVKLKSASITITSCWSARSRPSRMISGAALSSCSCSPQCVWGQEVAA